jgi:hypothetical protein
MVGVRGFAVDIQGDPRFLKSLERRTVCRRCVLVATTADAVALIRQLSIAILAVVALAGAQPSAEGLTAQTALKQAKQVEKPYKEGRYADAPAPAERAPVVRENTDRDPLRLAAPPASQPSAVIVAALGYGPLPAAGRVGVPFGPSPDAFAKATSLQEYVCTVTMIGKNAALTGPALMHIATHEFYAQDLRPPLCRAGYA